MNPTLSIVVPAKDEAQNLPALLDRLTATLDEVKLAYEIIVVDDGSNDGTLAVLRERNRLDPRVCVVSLSRNFGKEIAIAAGLRFARGAAVCVMDADLQHPPEFVRRFVELWREGYEVVYAQRASRDNESWAKRFCARTFYRLFARLGEIRLPEGIGDFILFDRKVVNALNRLEERTRFSKGLYAWAGYRQIAVPYHPDPRLSGASRFSFWRLWLFALTGFMSFTTLPLRVWSYIGLMISLASLTYGAYVLISTLIFGIETPGYASLMVAITFFAGAQLLSMGILGEYVGVIFNEVKRRPLFLVSTAIGLPSAEVHPVNFVGNPNRVDEPPLGEERIQQR